MRVVPLFLLFLLSQGNGASQTKERSAAELIQDFKSLPVVVVGSCGEMIGADEPRWTIARSLVKLGAAAIPDIDAALESAEKHGYSEFPDGFDWLLKAYAAIRGPAAFPRIRQMRSNRDISDTPALDSAAALSLGLTSYVRPGGGNWIVGVNLLRELRRSWLFPCNDGFDPRLALDFLILAWEKDDRALLEESLAPDAKTALDSLLKNTTWYAFRAKLWHAKASDRVAVGYRFDSPAFSNDPFATFWARKPRPTEPRFPQNPEFDTLFKDGSGKDCGKLRIRFLSPDFYIDNSNIEELLRVIAACAANE